VEGSTEDFHRVVFRIGTDLDYGDDGPNPGIDFPAAQLSSYQDVDNNLHGERPVCPFEQPPERPATLVSLITLKLTPQIRTCCQSTDLTAEAVQAGLLDRQLPAVESLPAR